MFAALWSTCSTGYTSTLLGTSWRLKLDVGFEPGSWMPKKIDGWGASGARLLVDALVDFEASPAGESEELVGPLDQTRLLAARGGSKIVTFEGEQEVSFESGGWCVQRPLLSKPAEQEGLLRFWLDCPSGCAKNDVSVPPGERIFFSTGVWDDADGVQDLRAKASAAAAQLSALESEDEMGLEPAGATDDLLGKIPVLGPMRQQFLRAERKATLRRRRARVLRACAPPTLGSRARWCRSSTPTASTRRQRRAPSAWCAAASARTWCASRSKASREGRGRSRRVGWRTRPTLRRGSAAESSQLPASFV